MASSMNITLHYWREPGRLSPCHYEAACDVAYAFGDTPAEALAALAEKLEQLEKAAA